MSASLKKAFANRRAAALLLIVLAGALLRIMLIMSDQTISRDGIKYIFYASGVSPDETPPAFPPMFIWLLRSVHYLGCSWELSGWLISLFSGIALIPVVSMTALRLTGSGSICIVAAFFTAFHPTLSLLSIEIIRDPLFLLLEWSGIYCLLGIVQFDRRIDWLMFGLMSSLATLSRFEGLELVLLLGLASAFFILPRKGMAYIARRLSAVAIIWGLVFLAAFVPDGHDYILGIYLKRAHTIMHLL